VFRAHESSRPLVFPGHPNVVPRMPSFVVLGGLHVFAKPPSDHSRRDIRHSSEYCDVKSTVGQSLNPAEIGQLLGRQKRGELVEPHAEVAEPSTNRAPSIRHGKPSSPASSGFALHGSGHSHDSGGPVVASIQIDAR